MALFNGALLAGLGQGLVRVVRAVGTQAMVLGAATRATVQGQCDLEELRSALVRLGLGSIPVVVSTAVFVGGLMVVQSAPLLTRFGAESYLGWGAGFGILREVGPVLTGLMISGRVGSNNTAELGTLTVTEQVDGLRALAIDPAGYLVAPRVWAIILTTVIGTVVSMLVALLGAAAAGLFLLHVHPLTFYNGLTSGMLTWLDALHGLAKALAFGVVIATSSTAFGLGATGGPPGVGRAVGGSVVATAVLIFTMDALVSITSRVQ